MKFILLLITFLYLAVLFARPDWHSYKQFKPAKVNPYVKVFEGIGTFEIKGSEEVLHLCKSKKCKTKFICRVIKKNKKASIVCYEKYEPGSGGCNP